MKALKARRRRRVVIPPPVVPSLHIVKDGDWRKFTRLLPKDCEVIGVVTIGGTDHGALVWLASTRAPEKLTGGEVTMLNQKPVRIKSELLQRQPHRPTVEIMELE
jgi:hypothetical protein